MNRAQRRRQEAWERSAKYKRMQHLRSRAIAKSIMKSAEENKKVEKFVEENNLSQNPV